jgi:hypothetical protein
VQLVSPHVYRDNMVRAALKKNFGKTPRRSTQVHSERAVNAEVPLLEGCEQLISASTDIVLGAGELDDTVWANAQGWLRNDHAINGNISSVNTTLRLRAGLNKPPSNQGLVQALVGHQELVESRKLPSWS